MVALAAMGGFLVWLFAAAIVEALIERWLGVGDIEIIVRDRRAPSRGRS